MSHYTGLRYCLFAFLVVLGACAAPVSIGNLLPGHEPTRAPVVTLHMDTDFTVDERAVIQAAADAWRKQTGGLAVITLDYDLDFTSVSNLAEHQLRGDHLVARAEGWMDMVSYEDSDCPQDEPVTERNEHECVLGWVTSGGIHNPMGQPIHGAFVMDRLQEPGLLIQVVLHEFGHALGLPHLGAIQAVMYPSAFAKRTACLKLPDLQAFCQVNACGNTKTYPCE